jgi:Na+-translocating ferredoxin:NAD+ oxidoreductase RnfE subunit
MVPLGAFPFVLGVGIGMTMQNLVLAGQNTVAASDLGAASSAIAFFRGLGGTIGVSVLGAVLARLTGGRASSGASLSVRRDAEEAFFSRAQRPA